MRRIIALAALGVLLGAAACSARHPRSDDPPTRVEVQNQKFLDVTVYVYSSGGQRVRLGTVPGVTTRTLTIPPNLIFGMTSLRFEADPIGSTQSPVSDEIVVEPGETVVLIIPA